MNEDTHHNDTWLITVLRIKGMEYLTRGKSLRQHVRMVLESAEDGKWLREVETSVGVDGQNCNRRNRLEVPSALERSWRIRVEVYIRPRKRKNSGRSKNIISGSCSYSIDELIKLETRSESGTVQPDHVHIPALTQYSALTGSLQLRIDPVIRSRRGNVVRRGTSSNGHSFLCVQLQRRRGCASIGHHGREWLPEDRYEEYIYHLKEETRTTSQIPRIYSTTPGSTESLSDNKTTSITSKETVLRKRRKYRGYFVSSDNESNGEAEDEDEDWAQLVTANDSEEEQEHGRQNASLIGIFALLHPILPIHAGSQPSIDDGFGEFLSLLEGSLCALTVYGHLCRIAKFLIFSHPPASQDTHQSQPTYTFSRYLPVMFRPGSSKCLFENEESKQQAELLYERVTKEWRVSGQVLLGLAAVLGALLAITHDSLLERVYEMLRPFLALFCSSVATGLACVVWNILWYGCGKQYAFPIAVEVFMVRALDMHNTYVSFAISARMPVICATISTLSFLAILVIAAYALEMVMAVLVCLGVMFGVSGFGFLGILVKGLWFLKDLISFGSLAWRNVVPNV